MYIKNQVFKDEDTLMEMLFDFSLGTPSAMIQSLKAGIEKDLEHNEAYKEYLATLTDDEDRLEVETEERSIRLAEALMKQFDSFKTVRQKLFGVHGNEEILLYEIDLV